jgi:hypothetical protein
MDGCHQVPPPRSPGNARNTAQRQRSQLHWVIGDTEYEWDRGGGCLGRQRRRGPTSGDNDCHLPAHEVCRHDGQAVIPTLDPLGVDRDCAAFMIAGFIEMLAEHGHDLCASGARPGAKISDHRHRRLLRARH